MNKYINQITGPVIPLPTPFKENGEVDYEALSSYVKFLVKNGIQNVMTTVGTSRYNLLSKEEIKEVNKTVVEAAGNANTIVANPPFGRTEDAVEFAKHSESIGATLFLAYYPERHYGDEYIVEFFKKISDAVKIGVLIHEMPMRNGLGGGSIQYSIPLLNRLLELENIVGVKEEALDIGYSNNIVKNISNKAVVIGAGGGMSRYLRDYWLGSKAFLGGIGNFHPAIELDFYEKMQSKDFVGAHKIVNEVELPFFGKIVPFGWHPSLKAMLAINNHMLPFDRKPMKQTTKEEMVSIRTILQENNWINNA